MKSIEINIGGQKYVLRGEEDESHLEEVVEIVRRKVEQLRKKQPSLSLQKAAMLTAFDLASDAIKGRKKALEYQTTVLSKASSLLQRVEAELSEKGVP